jgi:hypothetical protein
MRMWRLIMMPGLLACALTTYSLACGKERWAVKTLTDTGVATINRTTKSATVSELGQLDAPSEHDLTHSPKKRFGPVEITTYRINALLLGYRHEADEDFHLVLADPDDRTIGSLRFLPRIAWPIRHLMQHSRKCVLRSWHALGVPDRTRSVSLRPPPSLYGGLAFLISNLTCSPEISPCEM